HEVQEELTHDFEHPEIHDLGFVVRKLRQTMIDFWPGINFETCAVGLAWLQLKTRHSQRALDPKQLLIRRARNIKTPAPNLIGLGRERRHQRCEKLIAYRDPLCTRDILLIKRTRRALAQAEKAAPAAEPTNIDAFRPSIDAPHQTRIRRIILRVNRSGRSERHKITSRLVGLRPPILKIDIQSDNKVVFLFRRQRKEKLFPNRNLLGCCALELD